LNRQPNGKTKVIDVETAPGALERKGGFTLPSISRRRNALLSIAGSEHRRRQEMKQGKRWTLGLMLVLVLVGLMLFRPAG
jgi:hypothetical protein